MVKYEIIDETAVLTLDMEGYSTNVINEASMTAFAEAVSKAVEDSAVKGVVVTSGKKEFVVGADLNMLKGMNDAAQIFEATKKLNELFRKLETCGKPVVAAINGTALGGGYELALACHYRVAVNNPKIEIGLPEVQLGIFPGGGGTQRLPRMVGIQKGLELILQAKRLRPQEALQEKMIDALVETQDELIPHAVQWIKETGRKVQPWDEKGFKIPGGGVMTPQNAQVFTAGIALTRKQTYGNYPGARYAMSAIYEGMLLPFDRALVVESRYFTKALMTKEAKHMIRTLFFHLQEANKGGARPKDVPETTINKVGMLGAGMMGAGIAYVTATAGMNVVLKDVSKEAAEKGKEYSKNLLDKKLSKGHLSKERYEEHLSRILTTGDPKDLTGCDLVIEAVFEDRALKAKVTQEAEAVMNPEGVFASNTSTLPITSLAEASSRPHNFIGMHFFSPVDKMPLVEIIMGKQTSSFALAMAIDYVKKIKKTPIVVNDSRGFFTSRVFATYVGEGISLLVEGCPAALVENAGKQAGMPVGPLALADEVSLSLMLHIIKQTEEDTGQAINEPRAQLARLFVEKLDRPGKKAGKGFYEYPKDGKKYLWPELATHYPVRDDRPDYLTMQKRMLHVQALDAVRCLDEGVVREAKDADVGSIMGWAFAPYTGGVISYIDYVGVEKFVAECDEFHQKYGAPFAHYGSHYAERFVVPESLRKMAAEGRRFYQD